MCGSAILWIDELVSCTGWLIELSIHSLIGWLIDWLIDWLIETSRSVLDWLLDLITWLISIWLAALSRGRWTTWAGRRERCVPRAPTNPPEETPTFFRYFCDYYTWTKCVQEGEERGSTTHVLGGVGGHTQLLLALVIWPLNTHPFRDEAPFLLLRETPPTVECSLRCYCTRYITCMRFAALTPFLFHCLGPPSTSQDGDRFSCHDLDAFYGRGVCSTVPLNCFPNDGVP